MDIAAAPNAAATLKGGTGTDTIVVGDGTTAVSLDLTSGITVTAIENITVKAKSSVTTNAPFDITLAGTDSDAATADITGSTGADTIIFAAGSQKNMVTGFSASDDTLDLSAIGGKGDVQVKAAAATAGTPYDAATNNVILRTGATVAGSAPTDAEIATAFGEVDTGSATNVAILIASATGKGSFVYKFVDADDDDTIDSGEITLIGTLTGTELTGTSHIDTEPAGA